MISLYELKAGDKVCNYKKEWVVQIIRVDYINGIAMGCFLDEEMRTTTVTKYVSFNIKERKWSSDGGKKTLQMYKPRTIKISEESIYIKNNRTKSILRPNSSQINNLNKSYNG